MEQPAILVSGKCRICGCTQETPCIFPDDPYPELRDAFNVAAEGELTCAWMDFDKTLCTNLRCIALTPLAILIEMFAPKEVAFEGVMMRCET